MDYGARKTLVLLLGNILGYYDKETKKRIYWRRGSKVLINTRSPLYKEYKTMFKTLEDQAEKPHIIEDTKFKEFSENQQAKLREEKLQLANVGALKTYQNKDALKALFSALVGEHKAGKIDISEFIPNDMLSKTDEVSVPLEKAKK